MTSSVRDVRLTLKETSGRKTLGGHITLCSDFLIFLPPSKLPFQMPAGREAISTLYLNKSQEY